MPAHWNNGLRIDLSPSQTHYPDSEQISLSSFSLVICAWRRTIKCQFNSLWFQRSGLEPKIYRTRGKHAIHCILKRFGSTDVSINDIIHQKASSIKITEIDWVTNICICYFIWKSQISLTKWWTRILKKSKQFVLHCLHPSYHANVTFRVRVTLVNATFNY